MRFAWRVLPATTVEDSPRWRLMPRTQPARGPSDTRPMILDPILTELWIVALCSRMNGTRPTVHADVAIDITRWRAADRPRA